MKGLSKDSQQTMLALAATLATQYRPVAAAIARTFDTVKDAREDSKAKAGSLWHGFKAAIPVAAELGHGPDSMRAGLEIACLEAKVPAGSIRSYLSTLAYLAADAFTFTPAIGTPPAEGVPASEDYTPQRGLSPKEVAEISVKDARKRYQSAEAKALAEARAKLNKVTREWDAESLLLLVEMAEGLNKPAEATAEGIGENVEPQRQAANG